MVTILETVSNYIGLTKDPDVISERVREALARTISQCLTEPAYAVAYGGDVFVVVLPGFDHDRALGKAPEIRDKMLKTVYLPAVGQGVHLQASFGLATYPQDAADITSILAKADQAMFDVKVKGKNAVGDATGRIHHGSPGTGP